MDRRRVSGRCPKTLSEGNLHISSQMQNELSQSSSLIPFRPPRNWLCHRALERNWRRRAISSSHHACAGLSAVAFLRHEASGRPTDLRVNLRHSGKPDVRKTIQSDHRARMQIKAWHT